jgi:hypothetical protein
MTSEDDIKGLVSLTSFVHDVSYQRYFSIYRIEDVLIQLKIKGASEKFKNQPRPLLGLRSVNYHQHFEIYLVGQSR